MTTNVHITDLREKASVLPMIPGVYIMKGKDDKIIYVGKSKALKNRVSQYFAADRYEKHNIKTRRMVDSVCDFSIIGTSTEIEALALENKLIKLHQPKYNVRLKDAKSYPYIKIIEKNGYPMISVTRKRSADGGKYFGPYSGIGYAYEILETVRRVFALPVCKHVFPDEKVKPCLYAHIGQCCAPCEGRVSIDQLKDIFKEAALFLRGNVRGVKKSLTEKMNKAAEDMMFELAALWRDRIKALDKVWDRQKVVGAPETEYDAVVFYQGDVTSCVAIGNIRDGALIDCSYTTLGADAIFDGEALITVVSEYYRVRDYIPEEICVDYEMTEEERELLERSLSELSSHRVEIHIPQKGDKKQVCNIIKDNAELYAKDCELKYEKDSEVLVTLARITGLEVVPERIEAIDVSNYKDECITAGIVCFENAKPCKSGYRSYNIKTVDGQDDYSSMCEAIKRRASHMDTDPLPDLLLLDGGRGHVNTVRSVLLSLGIDIPILGMVKDEYHKTRTLTDGESEISIASENGVFKLIYNIQEEVHRFTLSRMKTRKKNSMLGTSLTAIEGIGPKKAQSLLKHFGSVSRIRQADIASISAVKGIGEKDAEKIYNYFKENKK